jgi:signal recognition particle receptor subunit beta
MELQPASFHRSADRFPVGLQRNTQDIQRALSPARMQQMLHFLSLKAIPAAATRGRGVFDTLKEITRSANPCAKENHTGIR